MKFGRESKDWPSGSLERALALANAKNLKEAVQKKINNKQDVTASQTMENPVNSDYEALRKVIKEVEDFIGTKNLDLLDKGLREKLALLPLTSIKEVEAWKKAWVEALEAGGAVDSDIEQEEINSF